MILALTAGSTLLAGVIQRITGLGFALVLIGPAVLVYGPLDGVTLTVLLAVVASLCALPQAWKDVDWRRTSGLLVAGMLVAPLGALTAGVLPEPALLLLIAAMAVFALVAHRIRALAPALRGRRGGVVAGAAAGYMHASSGLSGPPLAAYAVGDGWGQTRFAASAQVIFVGYGTLSVLLRGLPPQPIPEVVLLAACTAVGILLGTLLTRSVPPRIARIAMLACAWAGAGVVLVRAVLSMLA
ncbi:MULTISPECIES: TSUP family transporter [unclassified Microbacterium]|uniref:TSUP family transporter n=1 Tax=unclassified Microbacterium TaxID=2609290 RepID=UPI0022F0168C|nr:TSUP family transporter [Streptomyces sp. MS2A]